VVECPRCKADCDRDEIDVGVGVIYGPWEELLQLAKDFAAWDEEYPKGTIHSMRGERELDELFARARTLIAKAEARDA
jgi:hypothetical protein